MKGLEDFISINTTTKGGFGKASENPVMLDSINGTSVRACSSDPGTLPSPHPKDGTRARPTLQLRTDLSSEVPEPTTDEARP